MTTADTGANGADTPSVAQLIEIVRRGLGLDNSVPVSVGGDNELSNINYVYRVEVPGRSLYLKVVPERPKRFPVRLPRERVLSEAEGLRRFRALAGPEILIPEVLFVDTQEMTLAMTDVGEGRQVLFKLLPERLDLLGEQAEPLGRALGAIHRGTRGGGSPRPAQEEAIVRKVIFDGLLAPGATSLFPDLWETLSAEMQSHRECLIHGDLWSKNLLVRSGEPIAVVDFEGVCCGDPAFDLGTLSAVALVPALEKPELVPAALTFVSRLLNSWIATCGSDSWPYEVLPRTYRAIATFLAARGFGPFAYSMSEPARQRLGGLARSLAADPPLDFDQFRVSVVRFAGPGLPATSESPDATVHAG